MKYAAMMFLVLAGGGCAREDAPIVPEPLPHAAPVYTNTTTVTPRQPQGVTQPRTSAQTSSGAQPGQSAVDNLGVDQNGQRPGSAQPQTGSTTIIIKPSAPAAPATPTPGTPKNTTPPPTMPPPTGTGH